MSASLRSLAARWCLHSAGLFDQSVQARLALEIRSRLSGQPGRQRDTGGQPRTGSHTAEGCWASWNTSVIAGPCKPCWWQTACAEVASVAWMGTTDLQPDPMSALERVRDGP